MSQRPAVFRSARRSLALIVGVLFAVGASTASALDAGVLAVVPFGRPSTS